MITGRRRIVAPTDPVVTLDEMGLHLHLDGEGSPVSYANHPEATTIQQYVQAATDDTEGEDGWSGRAFMPQTWRILLDGFPEECPTNPDGAVFLPYPPLLEVLSVEYRDTSGAYVTMDPSAYDVVTEGDPHGFIRPLYLQPWPVTADRQDAVRVTFRCGYDATVSPANPLPASIKQYIMVLAALMYEHRELDVTNVNIQPIANFHAAAQRFRVYGP